MEGTDSGIRVFLGGLEERHDTALAHKVVVLRGKGIDSVCAERNAELKCRFLINRNENLVPLLVVHFVPLLLLEVAGLLWSGQQADNTLEWEGIVRIS